MPQQLTPRVRGSSGRPARARAARSGYTIVELLIAATLLLLIVASLGALLVNQFRMFGRTQGAVQVQRDLRTGLGLLPLDLRGAARTAGTPAAGDLTQLTDSSIQLRATIGASIVCAKAGATFDLPAADLTRNRLTAWYTEPRPGDTLLVYVDSTSVGPEDDRWQPLRITGFGAAPAGTCGGAPYVNPATDPGAGSRAWRVTVAGTIPPSVVAGAPMRFLRSARYSLYRPSGGTQWYLGYREYAAGAWSDPEAIAGPFEASGGARAGVRFTYFDTLGVALASATPTAVGRIDVTLRARSYVRGGRDSTVVRDSLALRVALRNRL